MKVLVLLVLVAACASKKNDFSQDKVCSKDSVKYLSHPKNKSKTTVMSSELLNELAKTQQSMQLCYEDLRNRTGHEEFDTCLVVGVDKRGKTEFYNFAAQGSPLDERFLNCARGVTKKIPYGKYGKNYILVQSYQFYYE
jgi:hypothetical protein